MQPSDESFRGSLSRRDELIRLVSSTNGVNP